MTEAAEVSVDALHLRGHGGVKLDDLMKFQGLENRP